jgi:hypothetical protein
MSYRLSKPGLRYDEEIRTVLLNKNQKYISVHGKIIFIICKSTLNLNWCGVVEPFKAPNEFFHLVPIQHTESKYVSNDSQN